MTIHAINTSDKDVSSNQKANAAFIKACNESDLVLNSGICALVEGTQVALFLVQPVGQPATVFACQNFDPIGEANVLSRGIVCSSKEGPSICSPLYKQHYSLTTGQCIEQSDVAIEVYEVKQENAEIFVALSERVTG